jgi:hypothetical protein
MGSFSEWVGRTTVSSNFKTAMWRTAGYQPHSVRVGDMWYRMNDVGPLGMYLSIAVDLYDAAQGDILTLPSSSTNGTIEGRNI